MIKTDGMWKKCRFGLDQSIKKTEFFIPSILFLTEKKTRKSKKKKKGRGGLAKSIFFS